MKPRADKHLLTSSAEESRDSANSSEHTPVAQPTLPSPVRTASGFDAAFLMLVGVGSIACGLTLSLGPILSWKLSQISDGFKHLGVQGGVLVMGGLIMASIGLLRRGQLGLRTPTTEQAEDRLLLEQLTKDSLRAAEALASMEAGLVQLENEQAASRRDLEQRIAGAVQEVVAAIPQPKEVASSEEAIFRLAASLDQVGMRIEQRLKTQYAALQDHLEDVGAAILSARNQMQGIARAGENQAAVLREEVHAQVECALEETGFWSAERRGAKGPSLGVLDTIEDTHCPTIAEFDSAGSTQAGQRDAEPPHGALPEDVDTKTRLIQLSSLLADPKLRQALERIGG